MATLAWHNAPSPLNTLLVIKYFPDDKLKQCLERGGVVKSAVIVIDMVSVQNLLAPFGCVLGKETL